MWFCEKNAQGKNILTKFFLIILLIVWNSSAIAELINLEADNVVAPDNTTVIASGDVIVTYKDLILTGDNVTYHKDTGIVEAFGNVIMKDSENYISAREMFININTKNGTIIKGRGFYAPNSYFSAEKIDKIGENTFELVDSKISSCNQETPDWSFFARKAKIDYGSYFRSTHTTFNIKDIPIFYTPYFVWPIKEKRESGFLIPTVGFSSDAGFFVTPKYFIDLGIDKDATFGVNIFSQKGGMLVSEYRFKGSKSQEVYSYGEIIKDEDSDSNKSLRWRIVNKSNFLLSSNTDININIDYVSDFKYKNDFDYYVFKNDKINNSTDENYSVAEGRINYHLKYSNLSLRYIDNMRYYTSKNGYHKDHLIRYPQIISEKIGLSQLSVFKMDYYADFNDVRHSDYFYNILKNNRSYEKSYKRYFLKLNFYKTFNLKITSLTPYFTQSFTYWNNITDPGPRRKILNNSISKITLSGSSAERAIYSYGFKMNFSEIYKNYKNFKHSIFQSLEYRQTPLINQTGIPKHIENDVIAQENYYSYRLTNYLKNPIWNLKFEILQKYDQTKDDQRLSPVEIKSDLNYGNFVFFNMENRYNYYTKNPNYLKNNIAVILKNVSLKTEYIYDENLSDYNTSLKYTISLDVGRLSLSVYQKYAKDNQGIKLSNLKKQENTLNILYNSECYSIGAIIKERFFDTITSDGINKNKERIIYLLFELKGLGGAKRKIYETNL